MMPAPLVHIFIPDGSDVGGIFDEDDNLIAEVGGKYGMTMEHAERVVAAWNHTRHRYVSELEPVP